MISIIDPNNRDYDFCHNRAVLPYTDKDSDALESVQRRGGRFIFGDCEWDSSVTEMLKRLNWVELSERRRLARLVLFFKIVHNISAIDASMYLEPARSATRKANSLNFERIFATSDTLKYSFFPRTIREWNLLPGEAVIAESVECFRQTLRDI